MTTNKGKTVSVYFPAEAVEEQELWERIPNKAQWVIEKLREDAFEYETHITKRLDEINKEKAELEARLETVRKKRSVLRAKLTDEQVVQRHDNIIRRLYVEAYDGNSAAVRELADKGVRDGDVTIEEIDRITADVQKKKERLAPEPAPAKTPKKETIKGENK